MTLSTFVEVGAISYCRMHFSNFFSPDTNFKHCLPKNSKSISHLVNAQKQHIFVLEWQSPQTTIVLCCFYLLFFHIKLFWEHKVPRGRRWFDCLAKCRTVTQETIVHFLFPTKCQCWCPLTHHELTLTIKRTFKSKLSSFCDITKLFFCTLT